METKIQGSHRFRHRPSSDSSEGNTNLTSRVQNRIYNPVSQFTWSRWREASIYEQPWASIHTNHHTGTSQLSRVGSFCVGGNRGWSHSNRDGSSGAGSSTATANSHAGASTRAAANIAIGPARAEARDAAGAIASRARGKGRRDGILVTIEERFEEESTHNDTHARGELG